MKQQPLQQVSPNKPQSNVKKKKAKPSAKLNPGWKPGRTKRRQALAATMIQKCFRCFLLRRAFRESHVDTRATFAALRAFHRARDRKVWRGVDLRAMSREELRLAALALNIPSTGKKVLMICRLQRWVDQQILASDQAAEAAARAAELHAKGQGAMYVCDATPTAAAIDLLPLRGKNISTVVAGHDSDAVYAVDRGAGTLWLCKTGGMSGQVGLCRDPTRRGGNNRSRSNNDEPEGSSEFASPSHSRWLAAPVFVHTLRAQHIVSATISKAHGLALSATGEIFSWGDNAHGELGVAVSSPAEVAQNRATVVTTLANYRAVGASAGGQHSVAVCDRVAGHDGVVFAWGSNTSGQLGVGSANKDPAAPPPPSSSSAYPRALVLHQVSTLRSLRICQVACGSLHSLALSDEGQVYAWGCSDGGRLGLGNFEDSPKPRLSAASNALQQSHTTPTRVGGVLSSLVVLSVACGAWHSACVAVTPSDSAQFGAGRVFTWGTGIYGQLGAGEHKVLYEPRAVRLWDGDVDEAMGNNNDRDEDDEDEPLVTVVACGMHHTAAVTTLNRVFAWGSHKTFDSTPRPLRLSSNGKGSNRIDGRDEVFGKIASLACGRTFTIFNTERRTSESFEPSPPSPTRMAGMTADARRLKGKLVGSIPRLDLSKVAALPLMSSMPEESRSSDNELYRRLEPNVDQLQRQLDEKQRAERIEAIDIDAIVHPLCRVCWACDGFQPSPLRLWTCRRCCHDKQLHGTRKPGTPLGEFEAVRKVQTLYRARKARQLMQRARERHYQRVFSIKHNTFFYYNLWRREISWDRPKALSSISNDDDIPIRDPDELPVIQPPLTRNEAACVLQSHVRGWQVRILVQRLLSVMYEKHIDLSKSDQEAYYIKVHEPDGRLCMAPIAQRRWDPPTPPPPLLRRLYSLGDPVEVIRRRQRANWTRDDAARALQQQFRRYRARKLVLKMARSRFRKVLDESSGQFYFYNVVTKESTWQTPRVLKLLGEHEDTGQAGVGKVKLPLRAQQRRGGIRVRREKFSDETSAATTIQALYRRFAGRKLAWERACRRYSKMVDPASGKCYYYDRVAGTSTWMKPAILGAGDLIISGDSAGVDRSTSIREVSAPPRGAMISIPSPSVPMISEKARQKQRKRRLQRLRQMTPDQAAELLQRAWRVSRARRELRLLLFEAYEKIYDPVTENFYFYNTKTGVVRWEKPSVLQFGDEIKERVGGGKRHRRKRRRSDTVTDRGEAAAIVRTFMRCSHARLFLHTQLHSRIQKLWDPESKRFYYFDALTGQSSWKKPLTLGDHDLPCRNEVSS